MRELRGIGVSAGTVVGPVARFVRELVEPAADPAPDDPAAEVGRLAAALADTAAELEQRAAAVSGPAAEVLEATALMAADPGLADGATAAVRDRKLPAARAVWEAFAGYREALAAAGGYLAARVADLDDVRDRVVARLLGVPLPGVPDPGHPFVLVAADLAPADTATLRPDVVLAIVTEQGGPTSHTAILANALGIPAVVACPGALSIADGTVVAVDGGAGAVTVEPERSTVDEFERRTAALAAARGTVTGVGRTSDGAEVALLANVGDAAGMTAAMAAGAGGVGLFRTEFLFLDRTTAPGRAEQVAAYRAVFEQAGGHRVVVRTLDAGADKPLPFLGLEPEPNPALGVRGLRTAAARPEILAEQLAAIAEASTGTDADVWVMAPMVSTPDEAADFVGQAHAAGLRPAGIMVEVPAVALTATACLSEVDFASIGTNDLGQYALAADRQSAALAGLTSPWQPGLLRLVALTAGAGKELGRPVGVCGEAAGDPGLAVVLVGLGVTSLSMTPRSLAAVSAALASVDLAGAQELAARVLAARSAGDARDLARAALPVLADLG
ncbi:MAG TPA: phosphoenolpyruvate--protein phosphotransferase [Mycobacteriales bacterium]|nr:phosphoenolpyruvate--protein phosphotransferase [Mycobacteriales bacterium]